jgi:hypothetical protein
LVSPSRGYSSRAEQEYMQLVCKALDASANVELSSNEMLWGFEADIVIRVYDGADAYASAPRHLQAYHQRGDRRPKACHHVRAPKRRDEHLRLPRGASGALGTDATGAAEEKGR